jgi:hypothetical protein
VTALIPFSRFIADPNLLGNDFSGDTWDSWRVTMKAAFGEPMTDAEVARFRTLADRDPPINRVRELWLVIGRRAGKDSIASAIATYMAVYGDFQKHLRRGERACVLCLAVDRNQAGIVFGYIRAFFEEIPLLKPLARHIGNDSIELTNNVDIVVSTNSFRAIRGRTVALAILDECAYWRDDEFANPDSEIVTALIPALGTLRNAGSMIIGISTAYRRGGLLFDKWVKHHGKPDPNVLVIRQPSAVYNPNWSQPEAAAEIQRDLELDPERFGAEWLSEWRSDLADFVDREVIDALMVKDRYENPPVIGIQYVAFIDVSGGSSDSMVLCIGHSPQPGYFVLDMIREWRPPFDPAASVQEAASLCRAYHAFRVIGDAFGGEWPRERFREQGISYDLADLTKVKIYIEALPTLNARKAELLDHQRMFHQFINLTRTTTRGGRDTIDHPRGDHDDIANAVSGCLVYALREGVPALWRNADLLHDNRPIPWPTRVLIAYATATSDDRGVYVCYWAKGADRYTKENGAIILIDYQQTPLTPGLFQEVNWRLAELCAMPVPHPSGNTLAAASNRGILCTTELRPFAEAAGLEVNVADGTALLQQRDPLLLACGAWIASGAIKISELAYARSRVLPIPLSEVRADAPESAACDAVLLGLGGALPPEMQPTEWRKAA